MLLLLCNHQGPWCKGWPSSHPLLATALTVVLGPRCRAGQAQTQTHRSRCALVGCCAVWWRWPPGRQAFDWCCGRHGRLCGHGRSTACCVGGDLSGAVWLCNCTALRLCTGRVGRSLCFDLFTCTVAPCKSHDGAGHYHGHYQSEAMFHPMDTVNVNARFVQGRRHGHRPCAVINREPPRRPMAKEWLLRCWAPRQDGADVHDVLRASESHHAVPQHTSTLQRVMNPWAAWAAHVVDYNAVVCVVAAENCGEDKHPTGGAHPRPQPKGSAARDVQKCPLQLHLLHLFRACAEPQPRSASPRCLLGWQPHTRQLPTATRSGYVPPQDCTSSSGLAGRQAAPRVLNPHHHHPQ